MGGWPSCFSAWGFFATCRPTQGTSLRITLSPHLICDQRDRNREACMLHANFLGSHSVSFMAQCYFEGKTKTNKRIDWTGKKGLLRLLLMPALSQLCGFASWWVGSCLPARVLLALWHLSGSAFSGLARVSLHSKQPLTTPPRKWDSSERRQQLWAAVERALWLFGWKAQHSAAQACLKLASPINHLHNEVKCLPVPSDIFVSLFIFNDDMALSVSSWLFIFHIPQH